ncbi:MAG: dTMP kinase [Anaerolineae bacterium]|nr:dTMP kinase [Anaerolineae bacterium]
MLLNPGPGKLIAMEGLDGAGTTTQSPRLAQWLRDRGKRVYITREPTPGAAGMLIRPFLTRRFTLDGKTLTALFAADRIDHLYAEGGVVERLQAGEWVIMDRYYLSSFAYQALALSPEEMRWLWYLHEPCLVPDVTFFLDVPAWTCVDRVSATRAFHFEIYENIKALEKVLEKYLDAIRRFRSVEQNIQVLDGTQPIEGVEKGIRKRVEMMFLDDTSLSSQEQQALWGQWPALNELRQIIESSLDLALITVKKIPESVNPRGPGGSKGGVQLEFGGPTEIYHVVAHYTDYYNKLRLRPLGKADDMLEQLKKICPTTLPRRRPEQELKLFDGGTGDERSNLAGF